MNSAAESDVEERYEVYKKAISMNSHAATPKRVPLYFLHGISFSLCFVTEGILNNILDSYDFVIFGLNLYTHFRCPV